MKIQKPKNLKGVNGGQPIGVADIIPYLPSESSFFDSRHWVYDKVRGGTTIRTDNKGDSKPSAICDRI